jgi:Initiator Replication protein
MHDFRRHPDTTPPPRADISGQGYIRMPLRLLLDPSLPPDWTALDLKMFLFIYSRMSDVNPWGLTFLHVGQVRKWTGATKPQIAASLERLCLHEITLVYPAATYRSAHITTKRVLREAGVFETDMRWRFTPEFLSLMAEPDHYARVHLEVVRQLDTRAEIQLYMLGSLYRALADVTPLGHDMRWTPGQLKHYFGVRDEVRLDNFKNRVVNPAIAKIKKTGAFDHPDTKVIYEKNPEGSRHETTLVRFEFKGESWVPRNWQGSWAKARSDETTARLEQERIDEVAAQEEKMRLLRSREAWHLKKEQAVAARTGETLQ